MPLLTRAQILAADDIKSKLIPVPEWGGDVRITTMTGTEYGLLQFDIQEANGPDKERNKANFYARLCAASIVDESGARLFTLADVVELGAKSAAALQRVATAAMKLNRIGADDVDELVKN